MFILSSNGEEVGTFDSEGEALMYAAMNGISPFTIFGPV